MDLSLSDEQKQLQESAERFAREKYTFENRRKIVATERGWLPENWAQFAELGWLGMAFSEGKALPPALSQGVFVGEHGSWNRVPHSGYKVVFVPFQNGLPAGLPVDVLTGFLSPEGHAYGRPVGVAMDKRGALLVADDVGNVIWRVSTAK